MQIRKWLALLLVLTMMFLTACQNSSKDEKTSTASKEKDVNEKGFPIVNEPINLTFLTGKAPDNSSTFEETYVWKTYAEKTNMNVKFELVPFETLTEKRNLVLASNDLPDAFYSARIPSADLVKYGKQGVFISLNDYIDQYAPNLKKLMEKYPDLKRGLTMPDGNIYSFPSFYDPEFLSMLIGKPLWVNKEWLDKLGMKEPKTTDELYKYLKAVKETDLNGNGKNDEIPYSSAGINELLDSIKGAWGLGNKGLGHKFADLDPKTNKLRFIRTDEKYKEMLEYVHKLYQEGLLDPEIFTQQETQIYSKGMEGMIGSAVIPNPLAQMKSDKYVGLGALKGPHGDHIYSHVKTPMVWVGAFAITSANKHPEATIRWMDHFFSEEGAKFYFMGEEGKSYTKSSDGQMQFTEEITKNPQGLTQDQALTKYVTWIGGSYPGHVQQSYFKGSESLPNSLEVGEKAEKNVDEIWNAFNFTEEEMVFKQAQGADLETFVSEMEAKFITGDASFDEWDKYMKQVENMGVKEYMDIEKAAYDRYMKQ